jgi:hypothetical protein
VIRWLLLALLLAGGCKKDPADSDSEADGPKIAVTAVVAGCAALVRGPICEIDGDTKLRLRVTTTGRYRVLVSGRQVQAAAASMPEVSVTVAADATDLMVWAADGAGRGTWTLRIRPGLSDPDLEAVKGLRRSDPDAARARMPALDTYEGPLRGVATSLAARLALQSGDMPKAEALFRHAMVLHRAEGRLSDEVKDGMALTWALRKHGRRFADARAVLAGLSEPLRAYGVEGEVQVGYYAGLIERDAGDLRAALRHWRAASEGADALGMTGYGGDLLQVRADLLVRLGRADEAIELLEGIRPEGPCGAAAVLDNRAWARLMWAESHAGEGDDPAAELLQSQALYAGQCNNPERAKNVQVNLALAALQRSRLADAARHLAAARGVAEPVVAAWRLLIRARLDAARGQTEKALAAYRLLARRARAAAAPEPLWRALVGQANVIAPVDPEAAIRALLDAGRLLDERVPAVPLGEGRASFLSDRDPPERLLVKLLLQLGREREAAEAARRSRRRALVGLRRLDQIAALSTEARSAWDTALAEYRSVREQVDAETASAWALPSDQLAALEARTAVREADLKRTLDAAFAALGSEPVAPPNTPQGTDVWLVLYPLPRADARWAAIALWAGGAMSAGGARSAVARAGDPGLLLRALKPALATAGHVRVMAYGALEQLDLHALLLDLDLPVPVSYSADLGGRPTAAVGRTLLVADPSGDLPGARAEAAAIGPLLGPDLLVLQSSQATGPAVRTALADARSLHFAGHGTFGADGWDTALKLADGARLTPGDILALPRVPATVVLAGCETAKTEQDTGAVSVSLANAFLAAGANSVIATTRPVKDEVALAFSKHLYASGPEPNYQHALEQTRRQYPSGDWEAWRLLTR